MSRFHCTLALALLLTPAFALAEEAAPNDVAVSDQDVSLDCAPNMVVRIRGSHNHVTIGGYCAEVVVEGNRNSVTMEGAHDITVPGKDNEVVYQAGNGGPAAVVHNRGAGNRIRKQETAAQ